MHVELTLDVNDPEQMIAFWSQILGYVVEDEGRFDTDIDRVYWSLVDPAGRGPRLVIQRVPEPVTAKARVHIDVHVPDIEAAVESSSRIGAKRQGVVHEEPLNFFQVLTDPEGNEFCFILLK